MIEEKKKYTLCISDGFMHILGIVDDGESVTEDVAFGLLSETFKWATENQIGDYTLVSLFEGEFHKEVPGIMDHLVAIYDDGLNPMGRMKTIF